MTPTAMTVQYMSAVAFFFVMLTRVFTILFAIAYAAVVAAS